MPGRLSRLLICLLLAAEPPAFATLAGQPAGARAPASWATLLRQNPSLAASLNLPPRSGAAFSRVLEAFAPLSESLPESESGRRERIIHAVRQAWTAVRDEEAVLQAPAEPASAFLRAAALRRRVQKLEDLQKLAALLATPEAMILDNHLDQDRALLRAAKAGLDKREKELLGRIKGWAAGIAAEPESVPAPVPVEPPPAGSGPATAEPGPMGAGATAGTRELPLTLASARTPESPAPKEIPSADETSPPLLAPRQGRVLPGWRGWITRTVAGLKALIGLQPGKPVALGATLLRIHTMITLDYRKSAWGVERIVLDAVANHLPADSGGTGVSIRLKQLGSWVALAEADPKAPTEEVLFEDDGRGYDAELLSILFSTKEDEALSVGQFGEGMKLVATAALRAGILMRYRSQDWSAQPIAVKQKIGGHDVQRLVFEVRRGLASIRGSQTIFRNPSQELLQEIFQIPNKLLALGPGVITRFQDPAAKGYPSRIIETKLPPAGPLYVKGVAMTGVALPAQRALFTYDLGLERISPDRQAADYEALRQEVGKLLAACDNPMILEALLREAAKDSGASALEFDALRQATQGILYYFSNEPTGGNRASPWFKAFHRVFGEKAILAWDDVNVNTEAKLLGYSPVKLNLRIAIRLQDLGVPTAYQVVNGPRTVIWAKEDALTPAEWDMLALRYKIHDIILDDEDLRRKADKIPVKVYEKILLPSGREVEETLGFHDGGKQEGEIAIKRSKLPELREFLDVYIHELGHWVTGAKDHDRAFVNFFTMALARVLARSLGPPRAPGPGAK